MVYRHINIAYIFKLACIINYHEDIYYNKMVYKYL